MFVHRGYRTLTSGERHAADDSHYICILYLYATETD